LVAGRSPVPEGRVEQRLLLISLLLVLLSDPDDLAQDLDIKALALRLGIDVLLIFGESLDLLVHLLDALDKSTELIARYATWSAHTFLRVNMTAHSSGLDQGESADVVTGPLTPPA
jgi:hypothetical protein